MSSRKGVRTIQKGAAVSIIRSMEMLFVHVVSFRQTLKIIQVLFKRDISESPQTLETNQGAFNGTAIVIEFGYFPNQKGFCRRPTALQVGESLSVQNAKNSTACGLCEATSE